MMGEYRRIMESLHCFGGDRFYMVLFLALLYDSRLLPFLLFWIGDSCVTTAVNSCRRLDSSVKVDLICRPHGDQWMSGWGSPSHS